MAPIIEAWKEMKKEMEKERRIKKLEDALKAIWIWAEYDLEEGKCLALNPKDVIKLCERMLTNKKEMKDKPE